MAEIIRIDDSTVRIEDGGVRFFLLEGKRRALMIDSGMNTPDALEMARGITELPIDLLNTHADPDHISGNGAFDSFYLHPAEWENYHEHRGGGAAIIPVRGNDVIDLGDRALEIIDLPGHTPGSIAVLDIEHRVLYGGDAIQDGRIYMFGKYRNIRTYAQSLRRLLCEHGERFDKVYPSHGSFPLTRDHIEPLISAADRIIAGDCEGNAIEMYGRSICCCDFGYAGFLCDAAPAPFRKIRRVKNAISDDAARTVLREGRRAALSLNGDGGYPYAIPIDYYYDEGTDRIYFHSAKSGHKIDAIKRDARVCLAVWEDGVRDEGDWAYRVSSCVVFGRAYPVTDARRAEDCLRLFANKYYPSEQEAEDEIRASAKNVQMIEIIIDHLSGKRVHEK